MKALKVDLLAVKLDLMIEPFDQLNVLNMVLADGRKVIFVIDHDLPRAADYITTAAEFGVALEDLAELNHADNYDAAVVITDKDLYMVKPHIYLRPATLAIGIECDPETTSATVFAAIAYACRKIGRSAKSTAIIGTSVCNREVIGVLAAVQQMEVPVKFFSSEQISTETTTKQVAPVESCALLSSHGNRLLLPQTTYTNVTIAIAEVKFRWWD